MKVAPDAKDNIKKLGRAENIFLWTGFSKSWPTG